MRYLESDIIYVIENYGNGLRSHKILAELLRIYYPWIVERAMRLVCPFCGRSFGSRGALRRHLRMRTACHEKIVLLSREIEGVYARAMDLIEKQHRRSGGRRLIIVKIGNPYPKFASYRKAILFLIENGILPRSIGSAVRP